MLGRFSAKHAVVIRGAALLPALYDSHPELVEGCDIPDGYVSAELTNRFAMTASDTTWLDWYMSVERFWAASKQYLSTIAQLHNIFYQNTG